MLKPSDALPGHGPQRTVWGKDEVAEMRVSLIRPSRQGGWWSAQPACYLAEALTVREPNRPIWAFVEVGVAGRHSFTGFAGFELRVASWQE